METRDQYGVLHRVWRIADSSLINLVRGKMRDKKLIIADAQLRQGPADADHGDRPRRQPGQVPQRHRGHGIQRLVALSIQQSALSQ